MDSTYRPQSPELSSYAPQSPDLAGLRPQSPDLSGLSAPSFGSPLQPRHSSASHHDRFGGAFGSGAFGGGAPAYSPTSVPQQQEAYDYNFQQSGMAAAQRIKSEDDDEYMPDAPVSKRARKAPGQASRANGSQMQQPTSDPTLGVNLRTSFPVARIKRIMQADEDIGKVAQVTPHVVSRALELFMIRLISASAEQARGVATTTQSGTQHTASGASKAPKKVLAQHMKKAILADPNFDFLQEIAGKVPDAPSKAAKKEQASDSEEDVKPAKGRKKGSGGGGKKRKDSGDDF